LVLLELGNFEMHRAARQRKPVNIGPLSVGKHRISIERNTSARIEANLGRVPKICLNDAAWQNVVATAVADIEVRRVTDGRSASQRRLRALRADVGGGSRAHEPVGEDQCNRRRRSQRRDSSAQPEAFLSASSQRLFHGLCYDRYPSIARQSRSSNGYGLLP
jgi:hypothetical protein